MLISVLSLGTTRVTNLLTNGSQSTANFKFPAIIEVLILHVYKAYIFY